MSMMYRLISAHLAYVLDPALPHSLAPCVAAVPTDVEYRFVFLRPWSVLDFAVSVLTGLNSVYASALCSSLVLGNPFIANGRKAVTEIARPLLRLCIMHADAMQSTRHSHYLRAPRVSRPAANWSDPVGSTRRGGVAGSRQARGGRL